MPPMTFRHTKGASANEQWLIVHARRLFVHTLHNHTLSISDDGRVAMASGPFLMILQPPPVPPFRPTLNPPLELVHSAPEDPFYARKDTLTTRSHLTSVLWTHHYVLLQTGSAVLTFVRSPPSSSNFAPDDGKAHRWIPQDFRLPSQKYKPPPEPKRPENAKRIMPSRLPRSTKGPRPIANKIECLVYTRLIASSESNTDSTTYYPFLVYSSQETVEIIPVSSDHVLFPQSQSLTIPSYCIHSTCATAIACAEGIQTDTGLVTVVAIADISLRIFIYSVSLTLDEDGPFISSQEVWSSSDSIPPGPIVSFSWSLPSTREALLTLAAGLGNDLIIVDWMPASAECLTSEIWSCPSIHIIHDAHEHVVTAVQICHDGSVVSAGMDGRLICWRVIPVTVEHALPTIECGITANVLQDRIDSNEPILCMERTANGFSFVLLSSIARQGQEVCDIEVLRKSSGSQRRTMLRILCVPPYGTPDVVEKAIMSCVDRLLNHPSFFGKPLTSWDASHFLHSFHDCAEVVVPRLRTHLMNLIDGVENGQEKSIEKFVQRCRVLLWFSRVILHPDGVGQETQDMMKEASRRLRNSLLFVHYANSLKRFLATSATTSGAPQIERLALESMCQFLSTWRIRGLDMLESALKLVRDVRMWMEPFNSAGDPLISNCSVCSANGSETLLVADGVDPSSVWCIAGHSFRRCVVSALPVDEPVSTECVACAARACCLPAKGFKWVSQPGHCPLCYGGC